MSQKRIEAKEMLDNLVGELVEVEFPNGRIERDNLVYRNPLDQRGQGYFLESTGFQLPLRRTEERENDSNNDVSAYLRVKGRKRNGS